MRKSYMMLMLLLSAMLAFPALAEPDEGLIAEAAALAERDGIPVEPLLQKIREGDAKRIPPPRIRMAMGQLHGRLVQGRAICGPLGQPLCVAAAADAVGQGAESEALTAMLGEAPAEDHARALVAVTTLGARGMSNADAIASVSQALRDNRLDALLDPSQGAGPDGLSSPPAVGRNGELPVQNPGRDRDQTGNGKAWGKERAAMGGRPDNPGNGNGNNGNNGNGNNGNGNNGNGNNGNGKGGN